jgi:hypothetical protein
MIRPPIMCVKSTITNRRSDMPCLSEGYGHHYNAGETVPAFA